MLSLPASRRSSHTRAIRRAACACEHCVSVASLSLLFRACKRVHVLSWGVKRLPNVVNSFPIPPFPSPYPPTPVHPPHPDSFPFSRRLPLAPRRFLSATLYYEERREREREMFVFFFLLLFFFFLFLFLVAALLLLDLIRRLISGGSTRHLFFKTKSRTSLRFLFWGEERELWNKVELGQTWILTFFFFFSPLSLPVQDVLFGFTRLFG